MPGAGQSAPITGPAYDGGIPTRWLALRNLVVPKGLM